MSTKPLQVNEASPAYLARAGADDLPPGYKKTEVGVIPADWEVKSLAQLGEFLGGNGFPTAFQGHLSGDYPFFKVSDMNNDGNELFMRNANHWISEEVRKKLAATKFSAGSIVFAKIGAAIFLERKRLLAQDSCLDNNMMAFTLRESSCDERYFHYLFLRIELGRLVSTTALPSLSGEAIRALRIPMPPAAEQRAIAEALSDVDGLIAALDKLIAKKRAIKQAAMQQLLTGKTRLPGFSGRWETRRLGEIGRFRGGNGFPTKYQGSTAGDYPFFKVSDMNNEGNETFMQVSNNYISETVRKQLGATAFPANSIVFAKVGAAVFLERKKILARSSCIDNNMAAFTLDNALTDYRFVHYVLLNTKLGDVVSTTALPSLSGSVLSAIEIRLPTVPEQTAIATVLSDMDAEIAALEARRDKTRALKQGMMQQLLTGRVRLVTPEGGTGFG